MIISSGCGLDARCTWEMLFHLDELLSWTFCRAFRRTGAIMMLDVLNSGNEVDSRPTRPVNARVMSA